MKKTVRTQDIAFKKAFTLIELLVVIAIIGILATLAVVSLQQARSSARDSKRIADIKQSQTALELFFNEYSRYPTEEEWSSGIIGSSTLNTIFMQEIPSAPKTADGECDPNQNNYYYEPNEDYSNYTLSFCLGKSVSDLSEGPKCASPGGILNYDCSGEEVFECGQGVVYNGYTYQTIGIGTQCWFAENLRTEKFSNGEDIKRVINRSEWRALSYFASTDFINNSAFGSYNNDINLENAYGFLYSGHSVIDPRGICPEGWRFPTRNEWLSLVNFISPDSGLSLHSCRKIGSPLGDVCSTDTHPRWNSSSFYGDNKYNFNVYPGGWVIGGSGADFTALGANAQYWTSESEPTYGRIYYVQFHEVNETGFYYSSTSYAFRNAGLSVRCIKN